MSMKSSSVRNRPSVWNSPNPTVVALANRNGGSMSSPTKKTTTKRPTTSSYAANTSLSNGSIHMNMNRSSASSSVASMGYKSPSRQHHRPEWNNYLTENDRFKVTPEELRKKKKMMISKHNVIATLFHSDDDHEEDAVKERNNGTMRSGASTTSTPHNKSAVSELTMSSHGGTGGNHSGTSATEINSLDLLVLNSDHEEDGEGQEGSEIDHHGRDEHDEDEQLMMASVKTSEKVANKKKTSATKKKTTVAKKTTTATGNKKVTAMASKKAPSVLSPDVRKTLFSETESEGEDEQGSEYGFNDREENYGVFKGTGVISTAAAAGHFNLLASKNRFNQTTVLHKTATSPSSKRAPVSPSASMRSRSTAASSAFYSAKEVIGDRDLKDIAFEIKTLLDELKYYEELSGERPILLSSDELNEVMNEEDLMMENCDQKKVIRFLVQMSCQTMTHLLKKELEHQNLQSQIDLLNAKFNEFTSANATSSVAGGYGTRYLDANAATAAVSANSRPPSISSVQIFEHNLTPAIPPPPMMTRSNSTGSSSSPKSPSAAKFPVSYINPYESYFNDDAVPPPPPPPMPSIEYTEVQPAATMPELDHWIEYSKRIGVSESAEAFNTMQQLTSTTQRIPTPGSYVAPSRANSSPSAVVAEKEMSSGSAQEAIREINNLPYQTNTTMPPPPAFTGASPTDLLFMYHNATATNSDAAITPIHGGDDYALSPHAAAELAARTYDLYSEKIMPSGNKNIAQKQQQVQGRKFVPSSAVMENNSNDVSSSYDAMIDRLSYNLTNGLKVSHSTNNSSSASTSNKMKTISSSRSEEQVSMIDPKSQVPTPVSAPLHPLKSRITAADYVHTKMDSDVFDTRKQLFDVSPEFREKRIYDATNGCF